MIDGNKERTNDDSKDKSNTMKVEYELNAAHNQKGKSGMPDGKYKLKGKHDKYGKSGTLGG